MLQNIGNLSDRVYKATIGMSKADFEELAVHFEQATIEYQQIKWILIFIFIIVASELLGLKMVSEQLGNLIAYLPKLISAVVIFAVGIYVANMAKKTISKMFSSLELTGGSLVGNIIFYVISIIVSVTALNQAGVNTDLITNNLSIIYKFQFSNSRALNLAKM